jgi:hypothetical protein
LTPPWNRAEVVAKAASSRRTPGCLRHEHFQSSRSCPSAAGHPETMEMPEVTPHPNSPPLPSPHGRGERGRGERVRGHFQSSEESRSASGRIAEERRRVRFLASPSKVKARVGGTPSPGPPRLVKTPAAVHPLPQGGEGLSSPWVGSGPMTTRNDTAMLKGVLLSQPSVFDGGVRRQKNLFEGTNHECL